MDKLSSENKFAIMPEWVIELEISHTAFRLYAVLARYADNVTHQAFPSLETLSGRLGCGEKTVRRAIEDLVAHGAIKKHSRGRYQSTLYTVVTSLPEGTNMSDEESNMSDEGSKMSPRMVKNVQVTRTTELEPKNDNHLTKRPKPKTADDYEPSEAITSDFEERYPGLRLDMELAKFRDHHMANGSKFADWDRAMRKWLRQASEWSKDARAARASMSTDSEWEQWKKENGYS